MRAVRRSVQVRLTPPHPTAQRDRGGQRQQHHGDLHHEDRAPRERRRQEPPDHRTERRPRDTGRGPSPRLQRARPRWPQRAARGFPRSPPRPRPPGPPAPRSTRPATVPPRRRSSPPRSRSRHRRSPRPDPRARTHRAAGTATSASTRLNAIRTHATPPTWAPKSRRISGNASVTTPESPSTTATASDSTATVPARAARGLAGSSLRSALIGRSLLEHDARDDKRARSCRSGTRVVAALAHQRRSQR